MRNRGIMRFITAATASIVIAAGITTTIVASAQSTAEIIETSTLPTILLSDLLNETLGPGTVADGRGIPLGGIGSDLFHNRASDAPNEFWMMADRGPNVTLENGDTEQLTFPLPEYTPVIVHVKAEDGTLTLLDAVAIHGASGEGITGFSNNPDRDPVPYTYLAESTLPYNVNGMDTEGLVRMPDGTFRVTDEYAPSIAKVAADGEVLVRWVPKGWTLSGTDYPVEQTLPEVLLNRRNNRGWESLGVTPDGSLLFTSIEAPLANPDTDTAKASRNGRIFAVNPETGVPSAEYVYVYEDGPTFDATGEIAQADLKVTAVNPLDADTLLVVERSDAVAKLFLVELGSATDILGTAWDQLATSPTLEQTTDLAAAEIIPAEKTLLLEFNSLGEMPAKIEGMTVIDPTTIAVANDNDFDITDQTSFDADGQFQGTGRVTEVIEIRLPEPLPIP